SFVFSGILFIFGIGLVIASFRQALTPISIQHFAEGFTMRMSINNMNYAITSISIMLVIVGCCSFLSSILLLFLGFYLLNNSCKINVEKKPENKVEKKQSDNNEVVGIEATK
ncbi:MAG: hypothetical protein PQJ44_02200, partial [Sphaerochaetaceae bacterium]|nr:hypothetical protein [Sphaerochaetaceae bacterium]